MACFRKQRGRRTESGLNRKLKRNVLIGRYLLPEVIKRSQNKNFSLVNAVSICLRFSSLCYLVQVKDYENET